MRRPRRRKGRRRLVLGASVLAIAMLVAAAGGLGYLWWKYRSLDRVDVDLAAAGVSEPQNYLVVGSDTRELAGSEDWEATGGVYGAGPDATGQRADTMLIARVDPGRTSVELLSIPRDLWVTQGPSGGAGRINAVYNEGPQALIDTLQESLGIDIHHYVEVDFDGFRGLVDAIGGVPMYFDSPVYDENTGLNILAEGCYNLDPIQALAFARSRHLVYSNGLRWIPDGTGDMGRITRQQVFLRRAMAKVATLGIGDLNTLRRLIDVGVDNVTVDDELGISQLLALGRRFRDFDADTLVTHRLPTSGFRTDGGAAVLRMDRTAAAPVLDIFRGVEADDGGGGNPEATTTTLAPALVTVSVLNGTSRSGLAATTGEELAAAAFELDEVGNATDSERTLIRHAPGGEAAAATLAGRLVPSPVLEEDPSLSGNDLVLVLGADHESVGDGAVATPAPGGAATAPTTSEPEYGDGVDIGFVAGDPPPGVSCAAT